VIAVIARERKNQTPTYAAIRDTDKTDSLPAERRLRAKNFIEI
jgi:hypothetical protein